LLDACAEEMTTVNKVISVRPMVSAAVVAATRRGLRRALAVASLATGPASLPGSQPRNATAPGTISGPSASTATKHRQPPAAISTKPDCPLTCCIPENVSKIPAPANNRRHGHPQPADPGRLGLVMLAAERGDGRDAGG